MLNPFQYVERLLKFQHRYSPVVPMVITRRIHAKNQAPKSWIGIYWMCGHYFYKIIAFEDDTYFAIRRCKIITPSDFLPSIRGYYETIHFPLTWLMFDELEFTGNYREKLIPIEKKIKIQTIKEQCFK